MNDEEIRERIKQILLEHEGANNPISVREINEEVDVNSSNVIPNIRKVISEVVLEEEIPVIASSEGYYLVQNEQELKEYVEQLESRIEAINERKLGVQLAAGAMIFEGESRDFELKDKRIDRATVVKELVALGNTEGGTVVIGASEQGDNIKIQTIDDPKEWEESVNQCLVARADPPFDVEFSVEQIGDGKVVTFSVNGFSVLRTFDPDNQKHCVPRRAGTTTTYLRGSEIARFYQ